MPVTVSMTAALGVCWWIIRSPWVVLHHSAIRLFDCDVSGGGEGGDGALLLALFQTQAQRARHLSPLRRWWVGRAQQGKLGIYGRRTI